jgi:hypothetical protein
VAVGQAFQVARAPRGVGVVTLLQTGERRFARAPRNEAQSGILVTAGRTSCAERIGSAMMLDALPGVRISGKTKAKKRTTLAPLPRWAMVARAGATGRTEGVVIFPIAHARWTGRRAILVGATSFAKKADRVAKPTLALGVGEALHARAFGPAVGERFGAIRIAATHPVIEAGVLAAGVPRLLGRVVAASTDQRDEPRGPGHRSSQGRQRVERAKAPA